MRLLQLVSVPAEAADDKSAAEKDEPEEESDDDMGFGLFDWLIDLFY